MKISTRRLVQLALLTGIEIIITFTPLGSIPIGPIVATLAHIPVIIAAIYLGYGAGIYMGTLFGLFSLIVNTFVIPTPLSFVFTPFYSVGDIHGNFMSLVICFLPRIILGIVTTFAFRQISKIDKKKYFSAAASAIIGSITHTVLVLGGIYLFFGETYSAVIGQPFSVLLGLIMTTIMTNGIPEAIIAGIVSAALIKPMMKIQKL